ncbi:hypothetical protein AZE42_03621 [Rhizopogon vesiculosus]|uniref:Ubiquitin 3 binding protein But2 C-terminal domain-containing protein n=1 Tax=Rhizopogon vesiculosus TaxID=180088 RepID=A0A1J8QA38_9AGAM|nr:hypothetical protein AZE42_03621 [Rhizopogon vesiculosus]
MLNNWFSDRALRTFRTSYSPLQMHDLEHQLEDSEDAILLPSKRFIPDHTADPLSTWTTWTTLVLSVLAIACAFALYITPASISGRHDVHGLRQPNQYPGLEFIDELKDKAPAMYFPSAIVRVNKASPEQVYTSGSHVILSDNDSMFFQWHLRRSKFTSCYIDSFVPTLEDGLAANKTYTSSGSLTQIQIWNVTTPEEPMRSLSWNSRPQRIALMGTVAFLPEKEKIKQLKLEDGWESLMPTRFSCGEKAIVSIEVACEGCRLEFEQLFSIPPLAFDMMKIG